MVRVQELTQERDAVIRRHSVGMSQYATQDVGMREKMGEMTSAAAVASAEIAALKSKNAVSVGNRVCDCFFRAVTRGFPSLPSYQCH